MKGQGGWHRLREAWPRWRRWVLAAYFIAVGALLFVMARDLDWTGVMHSVAGLSWSTLSLAALFVAANYLIYSTFDLIGKRHTGHRLATSRVMLTTFVSYSGNMNLGSLVGAIGLRQRLYGKQGLGVLDIARITLLSMMTNWVGYAALGGAVLTIHGNPTSRGAALPGDAVSRVAGLVLLAAVGGYLSWAWRRGGQERRLRGVRIRIPTLGIAVTQILLACASWTSIAAVLWVLFERQVPYHEVLFTLLAAAIAGLLTHVPAGVGILEATFLLLLAGSLETHAILAALLAYRALFYLLPLGIAGLGFLWLEARARRSDAGIGDGSIADPSRARVSPSTYP